MGGYPKFGAVIEADLWRLSQIPIGRSVRFIEVDYAQGIAALDEVERYLTRGREMVAIARLSCTPA